MMVEMEVATSSTWRKQKPRYTSEKTRPKSRRSRPKIANVPTHPIDDAPAVIEMILLTRIYIIALTCQYRIQACIITVVGLRTAQKHKNTTV